ncbi:hypothetical protein [Candidatus Chlorohelix sp.]|uniref:choice-of-anchor Y domain-containing protein n=1 Tax=Candidatus Chlorohelix sp. TaxID=3139201 RepID=UPI00306A507E
MPTPTLQLNTPTPLTTTASVTATPISKNDLVVLYDGALDTGIPDTQGFKMLNIPMVGSSSKQSYNAGVTTLDTHQADNDLTGYFAKPNLVPVLYQEKGFTLSFKIQIVKEEHKYGDRNKDGISDRAGFSVALLGKDKIGIELAFWTNQIWAQNDGLKHPNTNDVTLFTHGEGVDFNTTAALTNYELTIKDATYTLSTDNKVLLSNKLRDYSDFGFPYDHPNFLFLGDNSGSASVIVKIAYVAITTR